MNFFSNRTNGFIQLCLVIVFIVVSFLISFALKSTQSAVKTDAQNPTERSLFVETTSVTPQSHRMVFETTGIVEALTEISIIPQVSGRIDDVNPDFYKGGTFQKSEMLFTIDPRDFEFDVQRLQAEVTRAQTALQLEEAESKAAIAEWKLRNGKKTPPDLVARKPQMAEAKANLMAAQAQLDRAKLDLERTTFSLPFNGRVIESSVAIGRYVASGQDIGRVFNLDTLEIRASINADQLQWILNNENTDITILVPQNGQTKTYSGQLKRGASIVDPSTRFATVSFAIENAQDILPGVFANIVIKGPEMPDVTLIPNTSLQKNNIVWGVSDDQTLYEIAPDIAYKTDDYIAVRGISKPTTIVTTRIDGGGVGMDVETEPTKAK